MACRRLHEALQHANGNQRADADPSAQRHAGQHERNHHRGRLRRDEQTMAVPTIDVNARGRRQEKGGKLRGKSDNAEIPGIAGEPVHEPARGGRRDPGPDQRNDLAAKEEAKVPVAERAQHEGEVAAGCCWWFDRLTHTRPTRQYR